MILSRLSLEHILFVQTSTCPKDISANLLLKGTIRTRISHCPGAKLWWGKLNNPVRVRYSNMIVIQSACSLAPRIMGLHASLYRMYMKPFAFMVCPVAAKGEGSGEDQ